MNVTQRQLLNAAIKKLDEMDEHGDEEALHGEAEDVLCEFLRSVNYGDLADAFDRANERVGFWYA